MTVIFSCFKRFLVSFFQSLYLFYSICGSNVRRSSMKSTCRTLLFSIGNL